MFEQEVEIDTASLLLVDPCHLPVETVNQLISDGHGIVVPLPMDGTYSITQQDPDGPIIID